MKVKKKNQDLTLSNFSSTTLVSQAPGDNFTNTDNSFKVKK